MRVADDGKSIDISVEEAIKMSIQGFVMVCDDEGRVVQIVQADKIKKEVNPE